MAENTDIDFFHLAQSVIPAKAGIYGFPITNFGNDNKKNFARCNDSILGNVPSNVLLSRRVAPTVPSALKGLTAVFGMGTGVALSL